MTRFYTIKDFCSKSFTQGQIPGNAEVVIENGVKKVKCSKCGYFITVRPNVKYGEVIPPHMKDGTPYDAVSTSKQTALDFGE